MNPPRPVPPPVLLYDDSCGFCAASIQFILRYDRKGLLRFAPLNGAAGSATLERHPELRALDSVVLVEPATGERPERILVHSDAALRVVSYMGGPWRLLQLGKVVPRPFRDLLYRIIARHRHRVAAPRCVIPSERDRARFLG